MGDSRKEEASGLEDSEGPQERVRCVDPVTVAANCLLSCLLVYPGLGIAPVHTLGWMCQGLFHLSSTKLSPRMGHSEGPATALAQG